MTALEKLMDVVMSIVTPDIEAGQETLPKFVLEDEESGIHVLVTPWADEDQKNKAQVAVLIHMRNVKAVRCVFVSEGWAVATTDADELLRQGNVSDHPKREEMLMLFGDERNAPSIRRCYPILRPQNKLGAPIKEQPDDEVRGRFVNMFEKLEQLEALMEKIYAPVH